MGLEQRRFLIVLLCEIWLNKETEALVSFDNYKFYSNPRKSRIGGGVAILTNKSLQSRPRPDLHVESIHLEHIVVELKTDRDNILLVSGYRLPNANYNVFIKEYIALLKKLNKLKQHKIILGIDHNLDLLKAHLHKQTNQFLEKNYLNSFLCKGPRSILSLNMEMINKPNLHTFIKACKKLLLNKMST